MTANRRVNWKWVAGCLAAAGLIFWLVRAQFSQRGFDWRLAARSFTGLHWVWLAVSLIPVFATYYGRVLRWAVFLKPLKERPSTWNLLSATIIGFTAITLFGRAGDFVRPYLISVKEKVPLSSQLAAWLLERVFDLLMASLVLGFALTRIRGLGIRLGQLSWLLTFGGWFVGAGCLLVLVLLFSMRHFAEPVKRLILSALRFLPEERLASMERLLASFVQGIESTRSDAALLAVFLYSVLEWALIAACYWCVARAFSGIVNLTLVEVIVFMGFVSFGGIVQIPGLGGGTQVTAVFILTQLFHVRLELATSFAIVLWILTFVAIVPVGLGLALKEGLNLAGLRRIGREASQK